MFLGGPHRFPGIRHNGRSPNPSWVACALPVQHRPWHFCQSEPCRPAVRPCWRPGLSNSGLGHQPAHRTRPGRPGGLSARDESLIAALTGPGLPTVRGPSAQAASPASAVAACPAGRLAHWRLRPRCPLACRCARSRPSIGPLRPRRTQSAGAAHPLAAHSPSLSWMELRAGVVPARCGAPLPCCCLSTTSGTGPLCGWANGLNESASAPGPERPHQRRTLRYLECPLRGAGAAEQLIELCRGGLALLP